MPEATIHVRNLLKAAAVLGLTDEEVAAKLGVASATFARVAAGVNDGEETTVSPKATKTYAAAAAMIEEAKGASGSARQSKRENRKEVRNRRSRIHGNGLDASAGSDSTALRGNGQGEHPEFHLGAEHVVADQTDDRANADADEDVGNLYYGLSGAELIEKAAALAGHTDLDINARSIIKAAACADMDAVEDSQLVDALAKSWSGKRPIAKLLKAERDAYGAGQVPSAEERAARAAEAAQAAAEERRQREAELWASVSQLAVDPQLFDRLLAYAAEIGIIGEAPAVLAVFLTCTSRLLDGRALCLLRRGAPASGKNFVTDSLIKLMPPDTVIRWNGGSPKALQYFGGEDESAFVHRILYVPEAVVLARRRDDEPESLTMLRSLISDGEITYLTVVTREKGLPPITVKMTKKGPTSLIMTSARDDVEEEMLTRLLMAESDESPATTNRVVTEQHKRAAGYRPPALSGTTPGLWMDFNSWLEMGAPYTIVVPYAKALRAAYATTPAPLRIRRDAGNILGAIKAAAIVHRAQRQLDSENRIIAELADYEVVYRAFAPGLAALYRPRASPGVIALVEALERIKTSADAAWQAQVDQFAADNPGAPLPFDLRPRGCVQASYRQLGKELGISSLDTVGSRVRAALTEEVIEIVDTATSSRTAPRCYRIKTGSAVLGPQAAGSAVLPSPAAVQAMIDDPQAAADAFANFHAEIKVTNAPDTEADAALFREIGADPGPAGPANTSKETEHDKRC